MEVSHHNLRIFNLRDLGNVSENDPLIHYINYVSDGGSSDATYAQVRKGAKKPGNKSKYTVFLILMWL